MGHRVEGANIQLRKDLAAAITKQAGRFAKTKTEQAELIGIPQPWLSKLAMGNVDSISLDRLVDFANKSGLHVNLTTTRAASSEEHQI